MYFQLQNHEYVYSGVRIVLCFWVSSTKSNPIHFHPQCNIEFSILINSTFFLTFYLIILYLEFSIVTYQIMTWGYCCTPT